MTKASNLLGYRFERLSVLERVANAPNGQTRWLCVCDCGVYKEIRYADLVGGRTKSCGCLRLDFFNNNKKEKFVAAFNRLVRQYKSHAKKRNIPFYLKDNEIRDITKCDCFYCGRPPEQIVKSDNNTGDYVYNGIDRMDSYLGYFYENCVPCCHQCNRAKSNMTTLDFINWISVIYNRKDKILCLQTL